MLGFGRREGIAAISEKLPGKNSKMSRRNYLEE
jgi:hypothetical protein